MSANQILAQPPVSNNTQQQNTAETADFTPEQIDAMSGTMDGIITILIHWQKCRPLTLQALNLEGCIMDLGYHLHRLSQIPEAVFEAKAEADLQQG